MQNILNTLSLGDIGTWFTGFATFGAFVVAFVQINTERQIRKNQEPNEDKTLVETFHLYDYSK